MGSIGTGNTSANRLTEAIKAYTAVGGQYQSRYPFTPEKKDLLYTAMSNNEYTTTTDIYRKIDLTEAQRDQMFNQLYNQEEIPVDFNSLQSFTKERTRAFSYGGSQQQYVIYRIPAGTKINGSDIADRSIYSIEQEVLLGKNNFIAKYEDLKWTSTGNMIITLRRKGS